MGLCPFHSERTGSFAVTPGKNLFHCFSCNRGGGGGVRPPENSLLCVFGQATPAPTADDGIGRFSFDTTPYNNKAYFL